MLLSTICFGLCSFENFNYDLHLKWNHDFGNPNRVLKGQKQAGAVVDVIKNRVVDMSEKMGLSVLCVQRIIPGSTGK